MVGVSLGCRGAPGGAGASGPLRRLAQRLQHLLAVEFLQLLMGQHGRLDLGAHPVRSHLVGFVDRPEAARRSVDLQVVVVCTGAVKDVVVLIDRESGAREVLGDAGYELHSVFSLSEIAMELKEVELIGLDQYNKVIDFISGSKIQ